MSLASAIRNWDGKSADDIARVYEEFAGRKNFVGSLVSYLEQEELQPGASWLLKAWCKEGKKLSEKQTTGMLAALPGLKSWGARLHCLQCLDLLVIPDACEQPLERFLRRQLTHENTFVRAWAYNGYAVLSRKNSSFRREAELLFEMAMRDEPASVKARIRQIQTQWHKPG